MTDGIDVVIAAALTGISPSPAFYGRLLDALRDEPLLGGMAVDQLDQPRGHWVVLGVAGAIGAVGAGWIAVHHHRSRRAA